MGMVMLHALLPHVARDETRSVLVRRHPKLPDDDYTFAEAYCVDRGCDCRRVMLNVFADRRAEWLATISYAFDEDDPDPGPFLDPLNPQSEHARELLKLCQETVLADPDYLDRLERHYHMVKAAMSDPEHPIHGRIPARPPLEGDLDALLERQEPVRRSAPRVGRNSACPCGSGKKLKRCCGAPAPSGRR